jgi:hypothetical protein
MRPYSFKATFVLLAVVCLFVPVARADGFVVTLMQQGPNVVATGSGAIDLSGLNYLFSVPDNGGYLFPRLQGFAVGGGSNYEDDVYNGAGIFPVFGTGNQSTASENSGQPIGVIPIAAGALAVPKSYVSNSFFSNSSTYDNASFSSLGVTVGDYVLSWGAGQNQRLELDVVGTPEPTSLMLFGSGLAALAGVTRRKLNQ